MPGIGRYWPLHDPSHLTSVGLACRPVVALRRHLVKRQSAASIAGELVRGPRPLARRTSSWWTRLARRRTQPMRKKPGGGPGGSLQRAREVSRERGSRRSATAPRTAQDEPWCARYACRAVPGARRDRASSTGRGGSVGRDRVHRNRSATCFARWRRTSDRRPCRRSVARRGPPKMSGARRDQHVQTHPAAAHRALSMAGVPWADQREADHYRRCRCPTSRVAGSLPEVLRYARSSPPGSRCPLRPRAELSRKPASR